jgi:hypothetical protein
MHVITLSNIFKIILSYHYIIRTISALLLLHNDEELQSIATNYYKIVHFIIYIHNLNSNFFLFPIFARCNYERLNSSMYILSSLLLLSLLPLITPSFTIYNYIFQFIVIYHYYNVLIVWITNCFISKLT